MNTCRTCAHSTTAPGHQAMYRLGYRNCVHKPDWHFVPGHLVCNLNPIRWKAKE